VAKFLLDWISPLTKFEDKFLVVIQLLSTTLSRVRRVYMRGDCSSSVSLVLRNLL